MMLISQSGDTQKATLADVMFNGLVTLTGSGTYSMPSGILGVIVYPVYSGAGTWPRGKFIPYFAAASVLYGPSFFDDVSWDYNADQIVLEQVIAL